MRSSCPCPAPTCTMPCVPRGCMQVRAIVVVRSGADGVECEVVSATEHEIRVSVHGTSEPAPEPDVTLFAGLTKGHKMDLTVEKCVEIGVARHSPRLLRALDRPARRGQSAQTRHALAARRPAAAAQSQRSFVPEVEAPISWWRSSERIAEYRCRPRRVGGVQTASRWEMRRDPCPLTDAVAVLVGPEGGLTCR